MRLVALGRVAARVRAAGERDRPQRVERSAPARAAGARQRAGQRAVGDEPATEDEERHYRAEHREVACSTEQIRAYA